MAIRTGTMGTGGGTGGSETLDQVLTNGNTTGQAAVFDDGTESVTIQPTGAGFTDTALNETGIDAKGSATNDAPGNFLNQTVVSKVAQLTAGVQQGNANVGLVADGNTGIAYMAFYNPATNKLVDVTVNGNLPIAQKCTPNFRTTGSGEEIMYLSDMKVSSFPGAVPANPLNLPLAAGGATPKFAIIIPKNVHMAASMATGYYVTYGANTVAINFIGPVDPALWAIDVFWFIG